MQHRLIVHLNRFNQCGDRCLGRRKAFGPCRRCQSHGRHHHERQSADCPVHHIPLLALGWEITSLLLVVRTSAAAAKAAGRPWRGALEARVPARAEGPHVRSMAYAFEGMRPLFKMRRRTDSAGRTRAAWSDAWGGTANVGHVHATGQAASLFWTTAGATARLLAIAKFATTLKRRRLVSAEIATYLGRRARATNLLTQRRIPIEHTPAMDWIVLPNSHPVHVPRAEVEVVHVDNGNVAMRPVEGAEKEPYAHRNPDAPGETHGESGADEIAGPRRPIDRRVRRP